MFCKSQETLGCTLNSCHRFSSSQIALHPVDLFRTVPVFDKSFQNEALSRCFFLTGPIRVPTFPGCRELASSPPHQPASGLMLLPRSTPQRSGRHRPSFRLKIMSLFVASPLPLSRPVRRVGFPDVTFALNNKFNFGGLPKGKPPGNPLAISVTCASLIGTDKAD